MTGIEDQARAVFLAALERAPAEWSDFLASACSNSAEARLRVEQLLQAHQALGSIHDGRRKPQPATLDRPISEHPGTTIGPYKLLEQIGEGGFGVVFMAEQQQPVRRKVALKVLKPGMDTRQVVVRFEAERQALALMDHPNIAHVFDGGTTDTGRPYFVMELVRGMPINEFCDQSCLSVRQRLVLFVNVCQAVQHAHQKGIIHRDIKPANVMVTLHDGQPVVKVIDFGIAKAMGQQLTEKTLFTNFAQMVGTPLYMSPEQAELSGLDIDTRSDVYSLGVLLYELLTSTTPFESERLSKVGCDEMRRIIREEEPAKPSVRISTIGKAVTTAFENRQEDPRKLSRLFCGELDWIVMKALEKDRNRRYETASELAADLQHYLDDEPVLACPPSTWYRFRKSARRNKKALATGALIAATLLSAAGAVLASSLWAGAQAKARLAVEVASKNELERTLYYMYVALGDRELSANNRGRAAELLDKCPASLRGWEWHYLKRLLRSAPLTLPLGGRSDSGQRYDLAFSPNGRCLAAPSEEVNIKIWDAAAGQEVATLCGHDKAVLRLAFSPDGARLVSTSADSSVKVWDTITWREVCTFTEHKRGVHGVAFSPDGRLLASADQDDKVYIWDATTGAALHDFFPGKFINTRPVHIAFSPDGRYLASGSVENTVKIWDVRNGRELHSLAGHTEPIYSVAFSGDGQRLASAGWDNQVKVWDATTGQETFSAQAVFLHSPWRVEFSPDSRLLAITDGGSGGLVKVYEAATGHLAHELQAHNVRVASIAFSPDSKRLASAGLDRLVKLWDLSTGQEVLTLRGHRDLVSHVLFDPSGARLASASGDGTVRIWDATPLDDNPDSRLRTLRGHTGVIYGVAFSPDGRFLSSGGLDNTVRVWNARNGQVLHTLRGHTEGVWSVAFSLDGRLATASADQTVKLWNAAKGQQIGALGQFQGGIRRMALSPDGRRLATSDRFQKVQVFDAATGKLQFPLRGHTGQVWGVAFSPDGKVLATAGVDKTARIWDAISGQELLTFRGHTSRVHAVAFSPDDGRLVASGGADQTVKVWERSTGKELLSLPGHTDYVFSMAFSPDGLRLASASWREVIVWDAGTGREVNTLDEFPGTIWSVAFSPDGERLAAAGGYKGKGEIYIWDKSLWDDRSDRGSSTPSFRQTGQHSQNALSSPGAP